MTLTPDAFRARARQELAGVEHLGSWLDGALSAKQRTALAGNTRPFTAEGRQWAGFPETFSRVLAWYKPEITTFRDLGWRVRPDSVARVADALTTLIDGALSDPQLPAARREWLASYDVQPLATYTAIDDLFQTLTGQRIATVMDFGSGIGRQAFLWSHRRSDVKLYSVDAIESLYLMQSEAYRRLFGSRLIEYFDRPHFAAALAAAGDDAVVHLPTWRLAVVPDASVDLLVCVQVLQELSAAAIPELLAHFRRTVRPGGLLYIRDKEFWTPTHKVRIGRALLADGWRLIFRYTGDEGTEIAGVPRLWVNAGHDNSRYFAMRPRLKRAFLPSYSRSFRSWRDIGLPI